MRERAKYYVLQGTGEILKAFRAYRKGSIVNRYAGYWGYVEAGAVLIQVTLRYIKADKNYNIDRIIDLT